MTKTILTMNCPPHLLQALFAAAQQLTLQCWRFDSAEEFSVADDDMEILCQAVMRVEAACDSPQQLPADPEGMNERRSLWAAAAVQTFVMATGCDWEDALGDLLTNLRHWADRAGYDFDLAFLRSELHYEAETAESV